MAFVDWVKKPFEWGYNAIKGIGDESQSTKDQRASLIAQGDAAGTFATEGQDNFRGLGAEQYDMRQRLGKLASGEDSLSREQLRQGLEQLYGQQRSYAAGASPQNAPMAARTAAIQMGRAGSAMSGQAALAGIQERKAAMEALGNMINTGRQQELGAALGSRGHAIGAMGGYTPEKSGLEKAMPLINAGTSLLGIKLGGGGGKGKG